MMGGTIPEWEQIEDSLAKAVAVRTKLMYQEIERRILEGENDFTVADLAGGRITRYIVPSWRQHPINRFRIEWKRRQHRRAGV